MNGNAESAVKTERGRFESICSHLFALSTVIFLLGGAVIVICQMVLIVGAKGMMAMVIAETVGPYAFGMSSIAGLLAFVLTYFHKGAPKDGED